ncbi:hypothetical protein ADK38_08210 [Streptomyces varsoviensis]|uniref:Uncharacterized protein n=1 Tax=Streptomyces varsoviensis TaxID=67373 RepID=A0ABR5JAW8_9ACTN|nr:hypothetical protein ADK38_08210 [Streptomyces varsoviensis]
MAVAAASALIRYEPGGRTPVRPAVRTWKTVSYGSQPPVRVRVSAPPDWVNGTGRPVRRSLTAATR